MEEQINIERAKLNEIYDRKAEGYITRLKYTYLVNEDKNIKLLKQLENQNHECKINKILSIDGKEMNNQK